jgi:cbb3-type cytochrome oxidase maturation protein
MSVLFIALPVALVLAVIAVVAFVVQVRSGQFDDLETPPRRMLFDDVDIESRKPGKDQAEKKPLP